MLIKISGEMSLSDIRQAIFEKLCELEDDLAIRYSRGASLYINPTNGFGDEVVPRNKSGRTVDKVHSDGPYKSAADDFKL